MTSPDDHAVAPGATPTPEQDRTYQLARERLALDKANEKRAHELELAKYQLDRSFSRRYLPILATIGLSAAGVYLGYAQFRTTFSQTQAGADLASRQKDAEAQAAQLRFENELSVRVIELFTTHPEAFQLSGGANAVRAEANLRMLVAVSPSKVQALLNGIVQAQLSNVPALGSSGPGQAQRLEDLARVASVQAALAASAPNQAAAKLVPQNYLVYIQYPPGASALADQTLTTVRSLGYGAHGIEQVAVAPDKLQVRYYKPSQRDLATSLAQEMKARFSLTAPAEAVLLSPGKPLPDGILELWLPKQATTVMKPLSGASS